MPKVRKPKSGWPRLPKPRRFRKAIRKTGLPPCPECHSYSMKRDELRSEMYCTKCGRTL